MIIRNAQPKAVKCSECNVEIPPGERYVLPPISFHKLCFRCALEKLPQQIRMLEADLNAVRAELEGSSEEG